MSFLKNVKTAEQLALEAESATKRNRERELIALLDGTDHKVFPDYEPKEGEDLEAIKASRSEWRSEIRGIQAWLKTSVTSST